MAIAVRVRVPPSAPVRKSKGHGDVRDPFFISVFVPWRRPARPLRVLPCARGRRQGKRLFTLDTIGPVSDLLFRSALERTQRELDPEEVFQRSFFAHMDQAARVAPLVSGTLFLPYTSAATCGNAHPPEAAGKAPGEGLDSLRPVRQAEMVI